MQLRIELLLEGYCTIQEYIIIIIRQYRVLLPNLGNIGARTLYITGLDTTFTRYICRWQSWCASSESPNIHLVSHKLGIYYNIIVVLDGDGVGGRGEVINATYALFRYFFLKRNGGEVWWGEGGSYEIINAALYAKYQVQCNPSGTMLSLELQPQDDIVPEELHKEQHLHNILNRFIGVKFT